MSKRSKTYVVSIVRSPPAMIEDRIVKIHAEAIELRRAESDSPGNGGDRRLSLPASQVELTPQKSRPVRSFRYAERTSDRSSQFGERSNRTTG